MRALWRVGRLVWVIAWHDPVIAGADRVFPAWASTATAGSGLTATGSDHRSVSLGTNARSAVVSRATLIFVGHEILRSVVMSSGTRIVECTLV